MLDVASAFLCQRRIPMAGQRSFTLEETFKHGPTSFKYLEGTTSP
jgi:hypothetical protein